jgi:hypothetical protein
MQKTIESTRATLRNFGADWFGSLVCPCGEVSPGGLVSFSLHFLSHTRTTNTNTQT